MSLWDTCPACAQLGVDEPSIYDALVAKAQHQGRDVVAVVAEFFYLYHDNGHNQETAA